MAHERAWREFELAVELGVSPFEALDALGLVVSTNAPSKHGLVLVVVVVCGGTRVARDVHPRLPSARMAIVDRLEMLCDS